MTDIIKKDAAAASYMGTGKIHLFLIRCVIKSLNNFTMA